MRTMLVIGLGRFGFQLAKKLTALENEVLAIDLNEDLVNKITPFVTRAQIGNCMVPDVIASLDVKFFDVCFVCMGEQLQASLEITSLLKENGAPHVVAKTDNDLHAKFLLKIGADEIIYPEKDMADRAAVKYSTKNAFDYIELSPEYAVFDITTPKKWVGKSVRELDVRTKYNLNIIGVRVGESVFPLTDPNVPFSANDRLLVAGSKSDLLKLSSLLK